MPRGIYNRNKSARQRMSKKSQDPPTDEQVMERKALTALTGAAMNAAVEKVRLNKRLDHIEALVSAKVEEARKATMPTLGEGKLSSLAAENYRLTGSVGDATSAMESQGVYRSTPMADTTVGSLIASIERIAYERGLNEGRLNAKIVELSIKNQELLVAIRAWEEEQANIQKDADYEFDDVS